MPSCVNILKITGLHTFTSKAKAVQNSRFALSFAYCANINKHMQAYFSAHLNHLQITLKSTAAHNLCTKK